MEYLTRKDIPIINEMTIQQHGGQYLPPENLLNPDRLEYVQEAVSAVMFGEELYPTLADKAAVYLHAIVSGHVFQDGNKRTGYESAQLFLKLNGYKLAAEIPVTVGVQLDATVSSSQMGIYTFVTAVASGLLELDEVRAWFTENTVTH